MLSQNWIFPISVLILATIGINGGIHGFSPFPCDNDIYCYGDIIHTVQRAHLFNDSKTFVDMHLKYEPNIVKSNYKYLIDKHGPSPTPEQVKEFLDHNFDPPGSEFEPWVPTDWVATPKFLSGISDTKLRTFASELNAFWEVLGRRIKKDVQVRSNMYSMTYVSNPLIVPGGRFIEFYYWDQFWILKGLLHCEMTSTVRGMLENFMEMVEQLSFIPNGGRIYYQRSHPPLLIPMVQDFLRTTGNTSFLEKHIDTLDKEFDFWMKNRLYNLTLNEKTYTVARYNVEIGNPRPEAYNPDYDLVSQLNPASQYEQNELYMHLKTAAESGLDFSSRWFIPKNSSTVGNLLDLKTRFILPVDLNVLIYRNAKLMAQFHNSLNSTEKAQYYTQKWQQWEETINAVFWNETEGSWFDYDTITHGGGHKIEFYPGNILPLILNVTAFTEKSKVDKVLTYLDKEKVFSYKGGIPSSNHQTGEQWDFPNGWAPHIHWFIESLENSGHSKALQLAQETAQKWITNNYDTYTSHNKTMFEKYDVTTASAGGGGEYEVVIGFGWSNGVVLDLLSKYGNLLKAGEDKDGDSSAGIAGVSSFIIAMSLTLTFFLSHLVNTC